jgi:hypothetical protein
MDGYNNAVANSEGDKIETEMQQEGCEKKKRRNVGSQAKKITLKNYREHNKQCRE